MLWMLCYVMLCYVMWCYVMLCYVMYVASDRNHQQGATQATSDFGNRNHIVVPFNHCRWFLVPLFSFAARCSRTGPRSFRWSCSSVWEWCRCPYQCRTFCWQPGGRAAGAAGPTIVDRLNAWTPENWKGRSCTVPKPTNVVTLKAFEQENCEEKKQSAWLCCGKWWEGTLIGSSSSVGFSVVFCQFWHG